MSGLCKALIYILFSFIHKEIGTQGLSWWYNLVGEVLHAVLSHINKCIMEDFRGGPVVKTPNAGGTGLTPGWGTKIPNPICHTAWPKKF